MTRYFTETRDSIRYDEPGSPGVRIAAAIAGVLALSFSYVFVDIARSMPDFATGARLGGLAASVVGVLAFWAFAAVCLKLALFTPRQRVVIDARSRRLIRTTFAPATGRRASSHPFSSIASAELAEHHPEDSPVFYTIVLSIGAKQRIEMGVFDDRVVAQTLLYRIRDRLSAA